MEKRTESFGKRPLAPIFAKKPRTALFAHPNNQSSQNDNFSSSFSGNQQFNHLQKPMFPSKQTNVQITQPLNQTVQIQQRNGRTTNNIPAPGPQSIQGNYQQQNPYNNHQSGQNLGQRHFQTRQHKDTNITTWSGNCPPERLNPAFVQKRDSRYVVDNRSRDFPQAPSMGYGGQNQFYPTNGPSYGGTPSLFAETVNHRGPALAQQPYGEASTPSCMLSTYTSDSTPTPGTSRSQKVNTSKTSEATPIQRREAETSLRLLSATVQGMVHWAQYKRAASLMFELIGRVNSAVSSDASSTCKEFIFKDEKDGSVKCTFFEIDRPCPRLIRGRYYRCVGCYNTQTHVMNCVSIRPVTDAERKLHPVFVASSDKSMRALVKP